MAASPRPRFITDKSQIQWRETHEKIMAVYDLLSVGGTPPTIKDMVRESGFSASTVRRHLARRAYTANRPGPYGGDPVPYTDAKDHPEVLARVAEVRAEIFSRPARPKPTIAQKAIRDYKRAMDNIKTAANYSINGRIHGYQPRRRDSQSPQVPWC